MFGMRKACAEALQKDVLSGVQRSKAQSKVREKFALLG
jgi:hypothetical protein